jgi:DNA (cytosine-5)-methyltransferase 1
MSHVDLCSGIGGFALGFEWAGLSKPVLFCDIEPWSRKVLAKHWPDVPIADDVKELASDPDRFIPRTDPRNIHPIIWLSLPAL